MRGGIKQGPKLNQKQRLAQRCNWLERTVAQQGEQIQALLAYITAMGLEQDTAQLAFLKVMNVPGERWAELRKEAAALRRAGFACDALFKGWGAAFGHLVTPAEEAPEPEPPAGEQLPASPAPAVEASAA